MHHFSSLIFKRIFTGKKVFPEQLLTQDSDSVRQGPGVSAIIQGQNTKIVSCRAFGWMPDLFSEANFWLESCISMPCIKLNTTHRISRKQFSCLVINWFYLPSARYVSLPWNFPTPQNILISVPLMVGFLGTRYKAQMAEVSFLQQKCLFKVNML